MSIVQISLIKILKTNRTIGSESRLSINAALAADNPMTDLKIIRPWKK